jgi:sulfoxide reductase catalytic subunit YedY
MLIGKPSDIPSSAITPKAQYLNRHLNRRSFLRRAAGTAAVAGAAALGLDRAAQIISPSLGAHAGTKLETIKSPLTTTGEELTSLNDLTHYNNFYEFGVQKSEPALNAHALPTRPWTIKVEGLVKKPLTFDIDALLKLHPLEDRVYRHRCVEGWSMVIPWVGYSLSEFINRCEPLSKARFVEFHSYYNSTVEPWSTQSQINWPYTEGLRMDEAMNPLALFTFGLYGDVLPNQNGAPVRVVLPWKYGFKSAKSIVAVKFVDHEPITTWNELAPMEYGFYSNVNPNVDHPRWSQKTERRIGQPLLSARRTTLMFNGYQDQVASLYNGMNLKRDF